MLTYSEVCPLQWVQLHLQNLTSVDRETTVNDPRRLEAQRDHREVAIADTYTLMTRATIPFRRDL